jgi:hypothetical protein
MLRRVLMKVIPREDSSVVEIRETAKHLPPGCVDNRSVWGFVFYLQLNETAKRSSVDGLIDSICGKNKYEGGKLHGREFERFRTGVQFAQVPGQGLPKSGMGLADTTVDFSKYLTNLENVTKFMAKYSQMFLGSADSPESFEKEFSVAVWEERTSNPGFCFAGALPSALTLTVEHRGGDSYVDCTTTDAMWFTCTAEQLSMTPFAYMPCLAGRSHMRCAMLCRTPINPSDPERNIMSSWDVYAKTIEDANTTDSNRWLPPSSANWQWVRTAPECTPSILRAKRLVLSGEVKQAPAGEHRDFLEEELSMIERREAGLCRGEGIVKLIVANEQQSYNVTSAQFATIDGAPHLELRMSGPEFHNRWVRLAGFDYNRYETLLDKRKETTNWKVVLATLCCMANRFRSETHGLHTDNVDGDGEMSEGRFLKLLCQDGASLLPSERLNVWYLHRPELRLETDYIETQWDCEIRAPCDTKAEELEEQAETVGLTTFDDGDLDVDDITFDKDGHPLIPPGYSLCDGPEKDLYSMRMRKLRDCHERIIRQERFAAHKNAKYEKLVLEYDVATKAVLDSPDSEAAKLDATDALERMDEAREEYESRIQVLRLLRASLTRREDLAFCPTDAVWLCEYSAGSGHAQAPTPDLPTPAVLCDHCERPHVRFALQFWPRKGSMVELQLCPMCARDEPALSPLQGIGLRRGLTIQRTVDTIIDGPPDWPFRLESKAEYKARIDHVELDARFSACWTGGNPLQSRSNIEAHKAEEASLAELRLENPNQGTMMFPAHGWKPPPRRNLTAPLVFATLLNDFLTGVLDVLSLQLVALPILLSIMTGTHKGKVCGEFERAAHVQLAGVASRGKSYIVDCIFQLVPEAFKRRETVHTRMGNYGDQPNMDSNTSSIARVKDEADFSAMTKPGMHINAEQQALISQKKEELSSITVVWRGLVIDKNAAAGASRQMAVIQVDNKHVCIDCTNHAMQTGGHNEALQARYYTLNAVATAPSAAGGAVSSYEKTATRKRLPAVQVTWRMLYFRAMATLTACHAGALPRAPTTVSESVVAAFTSTKLGGVKLGRRNAENVIMHAAMMQTLWACFAMFAHERSPFRRELNFNCTMLRKTNMLTTASEGVAATCFGFQRAQFKGALKDVVFTSLLRKAVWAGGPREADFNALFENWRHTVSNRPWQWLFGKEPVEPTGDDVDMSGFSVHPSVWETDTMSEILVRPDGSRRNPELAQDLAELSPAAKRQTNARLAELRGQHQQKRLAEAKERYEAIQALWQKYDSEPSILKVPSTADVGDPIEDTYVCLFKKKLACGPEAEARVIAEVAKDLIHLVNSAEGGDNANLEFVKSALYDSFKNKIIKQGKMIDGMTGDNNETKVFPEHSVLKIIALEPPENDGDRNSRQSSRHTEFVIALSVVALEEHMAGNQGLGEYYSNSRHKFTACGTQLIAQPWERTLGNAHDVPEELIDSLATAQEMMDETNSGTSERAKARANVLSIKQQIADLRRKYSACGPKARVMPNIYDDSYVPAHDVNCRCLKPTRSKTDSPSGLRLVERAKSVARASGFFDVDALDVTTITHRKCSCFRSFAPPQGFDVSQTSSVRLHAPLLERTIGFEPIPLQRKANVNNAELTTVATFLKDDIGYTDSQVDGSLGLLNVYASSRNSPSMMPSERLGDVRDKTVIYPSQEVDRQVRLLTKRNAAPPCDDTQFEAHRAQNRQDALRTENNRTFNAYDAR